ncbi:acyl-CoA thioesterase [Salinirubrum litoreum]|uniref:Acyl-CoA thioesterase n=1 Tax=Salinirubrum litoreum TaxID=1126234 RepID=A0ABD5R6H5_9EURY|nr:thioesterase family protein [Salinirubrum litoreum]
MTFRYETQIPTRYRDLDPMGHVNNAVYASYCEQARMDYFDDVFEMDLDALNMVLAHLELDYERPITQGQSVTVRVRVAEVGGSSFIMASEVLADGEVAATCETTQVVLGEDGTPTRVPEAWRERVREFEAEIVEDR